MVCWIPRPAQVRAAAALNWVIRNGKQKKFRVLIFIVAYNAERTIERVLARIPASLAEQFEVEILAIDDSSADRTFEIGQKIKAAGSLPFPLHVLFNPKNQGYGGNQKIGYHYAIKNGFDFVALLHGDGQYAPEALPGLLMPLSRGEADAVFGSRLLSQGAALKGGMPLYKFVGNRILSWFQNRLLRTSSERVSFRLSGLLRRRPGESAVRP